MNRWVFPVAIVALLLNLVALLFTFLGVKPVSIVLGLAIVANLVVVIVLALRSRTALTKLASVNPTVITPPTVPDAVGISDLPDFPGISPEITNTNPISSLNPIAEAPSASTDPTVITQSAAPDVEPPADNTPTGNGSQEISSPIASADPVLLTRIQELLGTTQKSERESDIGGDAVAQDQNGILDKEELLDNSEWLGLVEECVELEGDLFDLYELLDQTSQHVVEHTILRIQEMLERSHVEIIANERAFNRVRHQTKPVHPIPQPGTPVTTTLHPGFAVGRRVLRRAQVQVVSAAQSDI